MDYKTRITIDLAKYGQSGVIELGAPTFRQRIELSNEISRLMTIEQNKTGIKMDNLEGGTWNVLQRMVYVKRAPFEATFDGFLAFTDRMDEENPGATDQLWDEICSAIDKIDNGEASPLEPSQDAETPSWV